MSVIITGTHTVPLKLTQSGQNPVTVVGTALITTSGAYAIGGSSLLPWSVTNRGTIEDTGSNGVGVSLAGGGTVVNGSAHVTGALISASGAGVVMGAAGVLDNYSKIVGGTVGVDVSGGAASVANFGTITGAGEAGVILAGGGTLMNGSSADTAALVSGNVGISVAGAATVTNYGQIVGTSGTAGLFMGTPNTFVTATLVNGSATDHGASINGGLFTSYSALSIINFGLIGGSIAYTGYTGCGLLNYGMLMGSIYATYVNVTNSGLITGTVASKYELALTNSGTILGDVTVLDARTYIVGDNSGMISGEVNLDSYAATAGFTNSGTVGGGIVMNGYYVSQTLTNTGLIQGGAVLGGLYQGSSISNTGTIVNTNGSGIVLGGNAINELINGSQQATVSGTVGVTFGFYHGTLVNYGTIIGTGGVAVSCAGDALLKIMPGAVFIGTVIGGGGSNTLELASAASAGTLSGLGSSFTGFGTIVADAGAHWSLAGSNSVAGGQVTIGAGAQITAAGGLTLTNGGGVRNSGTVVGTGSGAAALDFTGGGTVTNASGGEVLGVRYAVAIAGGAGYVSNAGLMTATQTTQVSGSPSYVVDLHAGGTVINTGTIAGYQYSNGIYIGGGVGTVTNSGLIESGTGRGSLGNRISKTGVALNGGGIVTNEAGGVIEGSLAGVLLNGAPATLVNSGVIAGGFYSNAGAFVGAKAGGSVLTNNAGAAISEAVSERSRNGGWVITAGCVFNGLSRPSWKNILMWTATTRTQHMRDGLRFASDLTDAEWAVLEPLLPAHSTVGRPPAWPMRAIVDDLLRRRHRDQRGGRGDRG